MDINVVDNRTFLIGLDGLYRKSVREQERGELLQNARDLANTLNVVPQHVPVEGYYAESPDLTEYFLLLRALQALPADTATRVRDVPSYRRLKDVTSSPLYGESHEGDSLFPQGNDALASALEGTTEWTVPNLMTGAHQVAKANDGFALVTLAALIRDPVVLAALRESVVLYARSVTLGAFVPPRYDWRVDPELAERAARFVTTFNALFPRAQPLPAPIAKNAAWFFHACEDAEIAGRCVRVGQDRRGPPRFYHWAIRAGRSGDLEVHDFWSTEIWTSQRYRQVDPLLDPHTIELN